MSRENELDAGESSPSTITKGWFTTESSHKLSGRRRQDTVPEMVLRRALHSQGARYRLQVRVARRISADVAFPRQRIAIFVDGCFWHGCPAHGRREFRGPNAQNWMDKIARNRERDQRATLEAQRDGWTVFRFWECEVVADPQAVALQVLRHVRGMEVQGPL